ncbi:MAG TPA: GNAT family N-acetyltransferase [Gaiellaceae bacterium]|nr:GNAT family N-acetyltransferase [Gaiellaceae bacterium]
MAARVRPAVPGDAARLVVLAGAVAAEEEGWLLADARWRSAGDERRYIRALNRHPDAALYVAELEGGELVGRLSLMRDPHPSSKHVADLGLMVALSERRKGIGSLLMKEAEIWADGARITKLELHVFPHNIPAIALYEKLGYAQEGLRRAHYRRSDGSLTDVILMAKHL